MFIHLYILQLVGKKAINELLRKPHNIPDPVLAKNVELCVAVDDQYGPIAMALHASLGSEYEFLLLQLVKKHKLHFKGRLLARSHLLSKLVTKLVCSVTVSDSIKMSFSAGITDKMSFRSIVVFVELYGL